MNSTYRIVVGVDGTVGADLALRWAAAETEARGGTVQAVMAWTWDGPSLAGPPLANHPSEVREYAERTLTDAVRAVATRCPEAIIATETIQGRAATVLVHAAANADLLVLGSHGHGRLHHAVLGSVAEECVRAATCPVVVVPLKIGTDTPAPAEVAVG